MDTKQTALEATIETTIARFTTTDATIALLDTESKGLATNGPEDKKALKAVRESRLSARNLRLGVEKTRVELKADALKLGQAIDGEARRIQALISPIESRLKAEEQKVADELERRANEEERLRQEAIQVWYDALDALGARYNPAIVGGMDQAQFDTLYANEKAASEEREQARIAAEETAKAEQARMEKEREELRLERERMAAERIEREKAQAVEDAKREAVAAAERAKAAEERAKAEAAQAIEREKIAQERAKLAAAQAEADRKAMEAAEAERLRMAAEAQAAAEAEEARRTPMEKIVNRLLDLRDSLPGEHGKTLHSIILDLEALND